MKRLVMVTFFSAFASLFASGQGVDVKDLPPIDELGTAFYMGHQGGLYPNGSNVMPAAFLADATAMAKAIQPLDKSGKPDANGKIGFITIGASTVAMFSKGLEDMVPEAKGVNGNLTFVNCGIGGQDLSDIMDPTANYWKAIDGRLAESGLDFNQVQVIWFQEDNLRNRDNGFETRANKLADEFAFMARFCKERYPNLKLFYVSGRHTTEFMPAEGKDKHREPKAYINGWACKILIERQIAGDAGLAFKGEDAVAPLILWGPYFWTQGDKPRADGYTWNTTLVSHDGVHPTDLGIKRVAKDLVDFWMTDPVSQQWFLSNPAAVPNTEPMVYMQISVNKTSIDSIAFNALGDHFRVAVVQDSVVVFSNEKATKGLTFTIPITQPGTYKYVIADINENAFAGKFMVDSNMVVKPLIDAIAKPAIASNPKKVIDPNQPGWVVNGTNKLPKLKRVLSGHDVVKAVVTNDKGEIVATIEDVLHVFTDLNALLERGEYGMQFYDADGSLIPLPEEFNSAVRVKF